MKQLNFLQRYLKKRRDRKWEKRFEKIKKTPEYKIKQLQDQIDKQNTILEATQAFINRVDEQDRKDFIQAHKEELDRTDPFKADKWKVVYDTKGKVSTVYFNGQELYGVSRFDIDFDASVNGQQPCFTYEGYGSVEVVTESE